VAGTAIDSTEWSIAWSTDLWTKFLFASGSETVWGITTKADVFQYDGTNCACLLPPCAYCDVTGTWESSTWGAANEVVQWQFFPSLYPSLRHLDLGLYYNVYWEAYSAADLTNNHINDVSLLGMNVYIDICTAVFPPITPNSISLAVGDVTTSASVLDRTAQFNVDLGLDAACVFTNSVTITGGPVFVTVLITTGLADSIQYAPTLDSEIGTHVFTVTRSSATVFIPDLTETITVIVYSAGTTVTDLTECTDRVWQEITDAVAYTVEIEDTTQFQVPIELIAVEALAVGSLCPITTATIALTS